MRTGLVQIHPALEPLLVDIDSIHQHPDNPNNGDLEEICASIEVSGLYRPVYVQQSTRHIVAGNGTWAATKMLDATQIPAIVLDIDDLTAKRIMLADNKIASLAIRDPALELKLLSELVELDSLLGTGYQAYELEKMQALADIPAEPGDFDVWPTLCVQVRPEVRTAYYTMTEAAGGESQRFEMMLRLAGWTE